jgi:hypothetical protein
VLYAPWPRMRKGTGSVYAYLLMVLSSTGDASLLRVGSTYMGMHPCTGGIRMGPVGAMHT